VGRSRKNKPLLHKIEVTDVAAEGKALCRVDDRVVFINNAVPGDVVDIQVTKKTKQLLRRQCGGISQTLTHAC
jgi:23S rRNA m(5)U-1939 methyltransferase (EC 2.1.1.-)